MFVVHNQHLESSIYSTTRVAWAKTSIHVQEYGTRHQHDFHLTPYFLESVLQLSLQPRRFSNLAIARRVRWGYADSRFPQLRSHLYGQLQRTTPNGPPFCPDSVRLGRAMGSCPGHFSDAVVVRRTRDRIPAVNIFLCKHISFFHH